MGIHCTFFSDLTSQNDALKSRIVEDLPPLLQLLYCFCDRHFLVIAQKTLKMWFVYPLTLRREFAGSSESVTLKEQTTTVVIGEGANNTVIQTTDL